MLQTERFTGLIAATHTPFRAEDASLGLRLEIIEKQAAALVADGVSGVFICGTTGEGLSMTVAERMAVAQRWIEVAKGSPLRVIVHVGANVLTESADLAAHAQQHGAAAVAMIAPNFFKPENVQSLVSCCMFVAIKCRETPFFYYDIPSFTNVRLPMAEFLAEALKRIPNYSGLKFTHDDLISLQLCLADFGERIDILSGVDELLLPCLAIGVKGAVGSSYNFAAPLYLELIEQFQSGDFEAARRTQLKAIRLIKMLAKRGYTGSCKALMTRKGIDVGPARIPQVSLTEEQSLSLFAMLDTLPLEGSIVGRG
jgi:N-acetylneuraminate lyase